MNAYRGESTQRTKGAGAFFRRAGWWGTSLLLGAVFFFAGALISLMNRDFSVAVQGLIVAALLIGGSVYIIAKKGSLRK